MKYSFFKSYRNFGLQLRPVSLTDWKSLVNLTLNLCNIVIFFSVLFFLDPYKNQGNLNASDNISKPLYQVVFVSFIYAFSVAYLFAMIYFLFYGSKIIKTLDQSCFCKVSVDSIKAKRVLLYIIVFDQISFLIMFFALFRLHWERQILIKICVYIYFYMSNVIPNIVFTLVLYCKLLTRRLLSKLENDLENSDDKQNWHILKEIKILAEQNHCLNQLMSFPLTVFLILRTAGLTMTICLNINGQFDLISIIFILVFYIYLFYVTWLCYEIEIIFNRIFWRLRNQLPNKQNMLFRVKMPKEITLQSLYLKPNIYELQFYWHEIDLYKKYFQLRMFETYKIDLPFFLSLSCLMLNYAVLITQTT